MKSVFALAIIAASLATAAPANDWSKPCFDGECAYDLPGTPGIGSGTFKIAGSSRAIADITPSAGWVILDCDAHLLEQEIRLVCKGDDEAGCAHLFNHGAEGKVVRLPESCGSGPFARIASASVAADQNIPGHISEKLTRRDGVEPQVHVLKVDAEWQLSDASKIGEVNFAFVGSSMPGPIGIMNHDNLSARDLVALSKRDVDGWSDYFSKAISTLKTFAKQVKDGLADKTKVQWEGEEVKLVYDSKGEHKKEILPKKEIDCKWGKASVEADVTAKYSLTAHVGGAMTGSIVPPQVTEIALLGGFSGEVDVRLHVKAAAEAGDKLTWPALPPVSPSPLQIPGVLAIGPTFQVDVTADAAIKLTGDIDVGANFPVKDVEFWYPDKKVEPDVHEISEKPLPLKLNADAVAKGSVTASVHVIPKLAVGFTGAGPLASLAKMTAYVALDGYIKAAVTGEGHAGASNKRSHARDLATRNAAAGFSGKVDIKAGINLHGGVDGKFLNIIEKNLPIEIWKHEWPIYEHSWAGGKEKRGFTEIPASEFVVRDADRADGLTCPSIQPSFFAIKK